MSKQIDANRNKRDLRPGSSPLAKRAPDNQAALKKHAAPLLWHTLGDEWCKQRGVELQNGLTFDDDEYPFCMARVLGIVHLRGTINGFGAVDKEPVLTLPVGYRPSARSIILPTAAAISASWRSKKTAKFWRAPKISILALRGRLRNLSPPQGAAPPLLRP